MNCQGKVGSCVLELSYAADPFIRTSCILISSPYALSRQSQNSMASVEHIIYMIWLAQLKMRRRVVGLGGMFLPRIVQQPHDMHNIKLMHWPIVDGQLGFLAARPCILVKQPAEPTTERKCGVISGRVAKVPQINKPALFWESLPDIETMRCGQWMPPWRGTQDGTIFRCPTDCDRLTK